MDLLIIINLFSGIFKLTSYEIRFLKQLFKLWHEHYPSAYFQYLLFCSFHATATGKKINIPDAAFRYSD